jgi:hypothetical protein
MSLTFCSPTFDCRLQCQQCRAIVARTGRRCRRRCCVGAPYCSSHWPSVYGLKVKPALYGKGLFAARAFRRGQWICPYGGEHLTTAQLEARYPGDTTAPYALSEGGYVEDAGCRRGIGSMANTADPAHGQQNNALYYVRGRGRNRRLWLKATHTVRVGDEVLCNYGHVFDVASWNKTVRHRSNRPCRGP